MRAGIVVFPGSNCDRDMLSAMQRNGFDTVRLWHGDAELPDDLDVVALPGGFSHGDYLRSGAMAAKAPIVDSVRKFAEKGGYVLGICNGFQILTEAGLLPGTMMRNRDLKFICRDTFLRVETTKSAYTKRYRDEQVVNYPIAHHDGSYYADDETIKALEDNDQIAFRYCTPEGDLADHANPNGSRAHIAGVYNEKKNVLGLMPHPERHCDHQTGGVDGVTLFESLLNAA